MEETLVGKAAIRMGQRRGLRCGLCASRRRPRGRASLAFLPPLLPAPLPHHFAPGLLCLLIYTWKRKGKRPSGWSLSQIPPSRSCPPLLGSEARTVQPELETFVWREWTPRKQSREDTGKLSKDGCTQGLPTAEIQEYQVHAGCWRPGLGVIS